MSTSTVYRTTTTARTVTEAESEAWQQAEDFFDGRDFVYVSSRAQQESVTDSVSCGPTHVMPTTVTVDWEFRERETA